GGRGPGAGATASAAVGRRADGQPRPEERAGGRRAATGVAPAGEHDPGGGHAQRRAGAAVPEARRDERRDPESRLMPWVCSDRLQPVYSRTGALLRPSSAAGVLPPLPPSEGERVG